MQPTLVRPRPAQPPSTRPKARGPWVVRHRVVSGLGLVVVLLVPVWWSLGGALTDPALGSSASARFAEWARAHGAGALVSWAENTWYSQHPPPVGGAPATGSIPAPTSASTPGRANASRAGTTVVHLPAPAPIVPIASPAQPGEGQWHPVGRTVSGVPAVYEAFLRPDAVHTSVVVGVAYMDTTLLSATLYSGSTIPGGGPWAHTAPVTPQAATSLVAAFNAGFLMSNSDGGYYTQGKAVSPLRPGAASFVIDRNGTATVAQWGRDASLTSDVVAVRQNLDLIVDGGRPVAGLNANDTTRWGATLGNRVYVWRSGVGVTADGALVYVGGPDLNITDLAGVLVRAGAVRAMELDINTDWVSFASYAPGSPAAPAAPGNGTDLLATMVGTPRRYFEPWWSRDFITMSARVGPGG